MRSNEVRSLGDASREDLLRAWRYSSKLAKQRAGNFYYAFIFMPVNQRRGIEALYAFCRAGDDAVDEEHGDRAGLVNRLRRRLDICYRNCWVDDLTLSLTHAINSFGFERRHFDDLLLGIESDLTVKRYPTFNDLRLYCYRVASTVGLHCLKIFGCDNSRSRSYAENLGLGMQLTNILRDVREDFNRGRIYLPQEDLQRFGITDQELFSHSNAHLLKELIHWEAAIYRRILTKITELDQFEHRVELSGSDKLSIARRVFSEALE